MKPKKIIGMSLPDIQIKDPSCLEGKMIHLDIENDNLIITIDYELGQLAIATALQLQGMRIDKALKTSKRMLELEASQAELEKVNLK